MIRSDREVHPARDLGRAWSRAFEQVSEPELRLRAALSLARTLLHAERAIVFAEDDVLAAVPGERDAVATRRLFDRARQVVADELISADMYVARIAPDRPERVALRWRSPAADQVEIARAIVASCGWALERRTAERSPGDLPDGVATLQRLVQLVHDAQRRKRPFAVVYLDVEPPEVVRATEAGREAIARRLRREVRANDHLGHLGGDAYLALLALEAGESEAYPAALRLLNAAAAISREGSANVGVAICPDDGVHAEDLVEKAGAAAMAAASVGGARPYWFRESTGRRLSERATILAQLRDGDPSVLLEMRYQPIYDATTGLPFAVTAAPSWRDAAPALEPPTAYVAREPDPAVRQALDRWTIAAAASESRSWRAAGCTFELYLPLASRVDRIADALTAAFEEAPAGLLVEVSTDGPFAAFDSFVRRLRALGARVGVAAATAPFEDAQGRLDFITVRVADDVRTLAQLAMAAVIAPLVIATGVADRERARWLARAGATALGGEGLAAPMPLYALLRWASECGGLPVL